MISRVYSTVSSIGCFLCILSTFFLTFPTLPFPHFSGNIFFFFSFMILWHNITLSMTVKDGYEWMLNYATVEAIGTLSTQFYWHSHVYPDSWLLNMSVGNSLMDFYHYGDLLSLKARPAWLSGKLIHSKTVLEKLWNEQFYENIPPSLICEWRNSEACLKYFLEFPRGIEV